jgi:hypothetical protein
MFSGLASFGRPGASGLRSPFLTPAVVGTVFLTSVGCGTEDPAPVSDAPPPVVEAGAEFELVRSPDVAPERPDARVGIASPDEFERFDEGETVAVEFTLSGYQLEEETPGGAERGLARAPGQHLHVILNNERYEAIYDISDPVEFDDLPAGTHHLRAFPGTDWHESVKSPGAFVHRVIQVGEGEVEPRADLDAPLLTYSRPVGEYSGADADSVLVDFYLSGARLSTDGYRVRIAVEGLGEAMIDDWAPYLLLGLPEGEHTVRLELLDPDGVLVPGEFNRTERTITISR